jgi:hypothetical protein
VVNQKHAFLWIGSGFFGLELFAIIVLLDRSSHLMSLSVSLLSLLQVIK